MITKVISLGGSIVAPDKIDVEFLTDFAKMILGWLSEDDERRIILVVGGGSTARAYQSAYREVSARLEKTSTDEDADWIGIMATRINAQLVKSIFSEMCNTNVVNNPTHAIEFTGRVLVASGWKPGFSSDNDAVLLAERFSADTIVNLSNIQKVYTDDPRTNPNATPLDTISWVDFCNMVGTKWVPGKNVPFDPVASQKASELSLKVICAAGKDIQNTYNILSENAFVGTTIG